jgi:hypothetical protein
MLTFDVSGNLVISDNDTGDVVFTTAQNMFTITDYVSGSVTIPDVSRTADSFDAPYTNRNVNTTLASIHPLATTVWGMFKSTITTGSGSSPTFGGANVWVQANGSTVINLHATSHQASGQNSNDREFMSALGFITFRATGGNLLINDRLIIRGFSPSTTTTTTILRPEQRIDYRLWCGFL